MDGEVSNEPVNTDMIDMFNGMVDEMFEYGRDILNAKRKDPADDLLSAIANAELEGHQLSPEFSCHVYPSLQNLVVFLHLQQVQALVYNNYLLYLQ